VKKAGKLTNLFPTQIWKVKRGLETKKVAMQFFILEKEMQQRMSLEQTHIRLNALETSRTN